MAEMNIDTKIPGGYDTSAAERAPNTKGTFESGVCQLNVEWLPSHSCSNLIKGTDVNISEAPPLGFARLFN